MTVKELESSLIKCLSSYEGGGLTEELTADQRKKMEENRRKRSSDGGWPTLSLINLEEQCKICFEILLDSKDSELALDAVTVEQSFTKPQERIVKAGFEGKAPRTPDQFVTEWKNSAERAALLRDIEQYDKSHPIGGEPHTQPTMATVEQAMIGHKTLETLLLAACEQLDIDILRKVVESKLCDRLLLSQPNSNGETPLSLAINSSVLKTVWHRFTEKSAVNQEEVIELLLKKGADAFHVARDSQTALLYAVQYGKLSTVKSLLTYENYVAPGYTLDGQLSFASVARDGITNTPLRAGMLRQDEPGIIEHLLEELERTDTLKEERIREFENGYGYLHLCAFLHGQWTRDVAKLLTDFGFNINAIAVSHPQSNHQETPLATALINGNWEIADFLYDKGADEYISMVPPFIKPPQDLKNWRETSLIPGISYTKDQFKANDPREWLFAKPINLWGLSFYWPWSTEKGMMRLSHRFLFEYSLYSGYGVPYMTNWVRYYTTLDYLVLKGMKQTAMKFAEKLKTSHTAQPGTIRIIERAIAVGIMQLYEEKRAAEKGTMQFESGEQERVTQKIERIGEVVVALLDYMSSKDKTKNLDFLSREIILDDMVKPESFWESGQFVFGLPVENFTTLLHLAVMGGLTKIMEYVYVEKLATTTDGAGVDLLTRVERCIETLNRIPEENDIRVKLKKEYKKIKDQLELAVDTHKHSLKGRFIAITRTWGRFIMWSALICLLLIFPTGLLLMLQMSGEVYVNCLLAFGILWICIKLVVWGQIFILTKAYQTWELAILVRRAKLRPFLDS